MNWPHYGLLPVSDKEDDDSTEKERKEERKDEGKASKERASKVGSCFPHAA